MQSRNAGTNEFTLQPGEAFSLAVHAEYVLIEKASGPVHLSVDEGGRQELTAGFAYYAAGANGFSKLEFLNDGAGAITVRIQYGWGELKDTRLTVSGVVETREVLASVFSPAAAKVVPAGGAVTLSVASAARTRAVYKNIGSSDVALSSSGVYVGHILAPGEVFETTCTGALNAVSSGAAGLVSVLEEKIA